MAVMGSRVPAEKIETSILLLRGHKVILDDDLAQLYGVPTKRLNEQVRRNISRFPDDFMFQLTAGEYVLLRSQMATLKPGRGRHRKYLPYAFTEQGVAMLSSALNSERAVQVNIGIMRAFVRLRQIIASNAELARKLDAMDKEVRRAVQDRLRRDPPTYGPAQIQTSENRVFGQREGIEIRAVKNLGGASQR